ncbi:hypothetical protein [Paraburkholderia sp. BR14320]|uniref:hypothetical protein n=1 Tax=unclassified Paraburkholderia TaxID=2615204 RepID=UPI0034CD6503
MINHDEHEQQMPNEAISNRLHRTLNRLAKWRSVFAGWQLGTRVTGDPESEAVRDHRELSMVMRAEVSALAALLMQKRVFTVDEFNAQIADEAEWLSQAYERKFPGMRATDAGISIDPHAAKDTMKGFRP